MATAAVEERELLKTISWFDGFVVALANPSFLITGLGALGARSGRLGRRHPVDDVGGHRRASQLRLLRARGDVPEALGRHRDLRPRGVEEVPLVRRPDRGVRLLDRLVGRAVGDRRRRRLPRPGPVLHVVRGRGLVVEPLVADLRAVHLLLVPDRPHHRHHRGDLDVQRARHAARRVGRLRHGRPAPDPARRHHVPALHHRRLALGQHALDLNWHSLTGDNGIKLVIVWLYVMCWSSYGMECCATFAPEYHDTARDTGKALRVAAVFGVIVYGLLPLGAVGTFGDQNITLDNYLGSFYADDVPRHPGDGDRVSDHPALCRHRARDEHRHGGRVAGALRHLPGRDDHPLVREAEPLPRAGERHDPGRAPEHRPSVHVRVRPDRGASRSW